MHAEKSVCSLPASVNSDRHFKAAELATSRSEKCARRLVINYGNQGCGLVSGSSGLATVRQPSNRRRLDLLLSPDTHPRTRRPRPGFETVEQCRSEDPLRAAGVEEIARTLVPDPYRPVPADTVAQLQRLELNVQRATDLANRPDAGAKSGSPEPTLASGLYMREQRLRSAADHDIN